MNSHLGAQEKSPNLDLLPSPCQSQHLNSLQHNYRNYRQKLIEVSLPLEAINKESAREKSIRHRHPSTLHLWWVRRPLAACRTLLFASLVDAPPITLPVSCLGLDCAG